MQLDEFFRNLGCLAATLGAQVKEGTIEGIPLEELDLTGPAPGHVALSGPAQVVLSDGEALAIDIEGGSTDQAVRFARGESRLTIAGGDRDTVVKITLPAPRKLSVAGSGRMTAARLAADAKVSIAGSGRIEVAQVEGERLSVSIAGSGRVAIDGRAGELKLSIAGSGSCDAEGLSVDRAAVHIAGSGDAIFTCNGEVVAHLMGSGNLIVRGSARCSVHSMGSGTVTCERERETAG